MIQENNLGQAAKVIIGSTSAKSGTQLSQKAKTHQILQGSSNVARYYKKEEV